MRVFLATAVVWIALLAGVHAHEVRPAYLELRETTPDTYEALWKVPARGDRRLGIYPRLPSDARHTSEPRGHFTDAAYLERWTFERKGGLEGQPIGIDGLSATRIDALIRVTSLDGLTQTYRVTPDEPEVTLVAQPGRWNVAATYTVLGVQHILLGIDHLLFVLALMLLVKDWHRLVATITAFTVAHSITLAAATIGLVHVPGPPVEACIALSIVFVATEIVHGYRGRPENGHGRPARESIEHGRVARAPLVERAPWIVAFTFGLLHGLGFASALTEVGLPQTAIPIALLFFNVGVELGQLAFIAVVLGVIAVARRIPLARPEWAQLVPPYAIGAIAMFWVIERITGF